MAARVYCVRARLGVQNASLIQPPGKYTVTLSAGGKEYKQTLTVLKDPHSRGTEADIQAQFKLAQEIEKEIDGVHRAINQVEIVRGQLASLSQIVADDPSNAKPIHDAAQSLDQKLFTFESNLYQVKATGRGEDQWRYAPALIAKLQYLESEVTSSDFPPTTQQVAVNQELAKQATDRRAELDKLLAEDVAGFNAVLKQHNVSGVYTGGR